MAKAAAPPLALAKTRAAFLKQISVHGPPMLRALLYDHWADHAPCSWLAQLQADVRCVSQYLPGLGELLPSGSEVECLLEAVADSPSWWFQKVQAAEKVFQHDLSAWLHQPGQIVTEDTAEDRPFRCGLCPCSFALRKHLHAHQARAHRQFSPARHFTLTEYCFSCHRFYGSIRQSQQHLKASPPCLLRLAHVFPPLTYEQILALEGPEKCAQARVQKGHWRDFNGGPPPSRAPLVFGPVCPTLVERGDSLSDTDEHSSLLSLRLYRPSESVLQWITAHVSGKSTEGVRTTTTRFWLRRPGLFHRNSA